MRILLSRYEGRDKVYSKIIKVYFKGSLNAGGALTFESLFAAVGRGRDRVVIAEVSSFSRKLAARQHTDNRIDIHNTGGAINDPAHSQANLALQKKTLSSAALSRRCQRRGHVLAFLGSAHEYQPLLKHWSWCPGSPITEFVVSNARLNSPTFENGVQKL